MDLTSRLEKGVCNGKSQQLEGVGNGSGGAPSHASAGAGEACYGSDHPSILATDIANAVTSNPAFVSAASFAFNLSRQPG
jgi:hypothetical protein